MSHQIVNCALQTIMLKTAALGVKVCTNARCGPRTLPLPRILIRSFHAGFLTAIELVFKSSSAVRFAQTHLEKRNNRKVTAGSQLIMLSLQCKVQSH